jgi:tRNA pseudouridine13 synthase
VSFDPLALPPLLTADLPGIGGRIKEVPEDFEVEEIPAYEPSGSGEHLYLWIEKRGMGAEYFVRQVAQRLGLKAGEVGSAGLKDRHAVTRQMISVPDVGDERLAKLDGDGIRLLRLSRHTNKLKPGHLRGNRFRILIRQPVADAVQRLSPILERLREQGLPNYYGGQRFGRDGETLRLGMALLRRERPGGIRNRFLRKLALSAAQAALFNHYLARRLTDGLFRRVLAGDVMSKWPVGGMFVATDVEPEQARFDRREIVHTGPIFGRKMFQSGADAAAREAEILAGVGFAADAFSGFGKLVEGTRRHNLVYVDDLAFEPVADGISLSFTLPAGSYATVLLQEIMKLTVPAELSDA